MSSTRYWDIVSVIGENSDSGLNVFYDLVITESQIISSDPKKYCEKLNQSPSPFRALLASRFQHSVRLLTFFHTITLPIVLLLEVPLRIVATIFVKFYVHCRKKLEESNWWAPFWLMAFIFNSLIAQPLFFLANSMLHARGLLYGLTNIKVFFRSLMCLMMDAIIASVVYILSAIFPIATPYLTAVSTSISAWSTAVAYVAMVIAGAGIGCVAKKSNEAVAKVMRRTLGLFKTLKKTNEGENKEVENNLEESLLDDEHKSESRLTEKREQEEESQAEEKKQETHIIIGSPSTRSTLSATTTQTANESMISEDSRRSSQPSISSSGLLSMFIPPAVRSTSENAAPSSTPSTTRTIRGENRRASLPDLSKEVQTSVLSVTLFDNNSSAPSSTSSTTRSIRSVRRLSNIFTGPVIDEGSPLDSGRDFSARPQTNGEGLDNEEEERSSASIAQLQSRIAAQVKLPRPR